MSEQDPQGAQAAHTSSAFASASGSPPAATSQSVLANNSQPEGSAADARWAHQWHTTGRPSIIEVGTKQPWYRRRGWLFVKQQLESCFETGDWGVMLWKLKIDPGGREYWLPVRTEQLMSVVPGVSAHPTLEEIKNLDFLVRVVDKLQQHASERLRIAKKRYEEIHGRPWEPPATSEEPATAGNRHEDGQDDGVSTSEGRDDPRVAKWQHAWRHSD